MRVEKTVFSHAHFTKKNGINDSSIRQTIGAEDDNGGDDDDGDDAYDNDDDINDNDDDEVC